ncbi:type II toxin-antitoxin system HipA family toxin [Porticoccaceae bacterium LTM1]|nr:type II toxin-antitoxin system HipA family toxin [Porticoccaceae bacterium LTM1]
MVDRVDTALVQLWGMTVGAVSWLADRDLAVFEFEPDFLRRGLDLSPINMPLQDALRGDGLYSFAGLNRDTYKGLPGLLADSLPDKFGNNLIDAWLARNGRSGADFSPVERLCYTGSRGMGALEFAPAINRRGQEQSVPVEVAELVKLAQQITAERSQLQVAFDFERPAESQNGEAMLDILRVGTSAGGARPKAIIAMNDDGDVRSGQVEAPEGFDYWLLKFDGVDDLELGKPKGYGRIEYGYYLMAQKAGIQMSECRLLEEGGRAHFMTRRFDRQRDSKGKMRKQHMQTLCGVAHFDFNMPGAYGYEQAFTVMRQLRLSRIEAEQQFRRMVLNVLARNQDDHTKNIAFLMDEDGQWRLSPAYDVTYAHNPAGVWTNQHQMSINGKRDHFTVQDLLDVGHSISLPRPKQVIDEVHAAVQAWPEFAKQAGVAEKVSKQIGNAHRQL